MAGATSSPKSVTPPTTTSPQRKTFAQELCQLPKPCVKGDAISITIPEDEYVAGLESCKNHLLGYLILPKGDTPLKVDDLRRKLTSLWTPLGLLGIISLGKRFYEFVFSSVEELQRVRSVSSWNLKPGFLKLDSWVPDFNPDMQKQTSVQCWIRIKGLSQEYWRSKIIFAIAGSVGTPICLDATTSKPPLDRSFGHYARILVDIDLTSQLQHQILVKRKDFAFFVGIDYENIPEFCTYCHTIGHSRGSCRKIDICTEVPHNSGHTRPAVNPKATHPRRGVSKYVPKPQAVPVVTGKGNEDILIQADKGKEVLINDLPIQADLAKEVKVEAQKDLFIEHVEVNRDALVGVNNVSFAVHSSPNPLVGLVANTTQDASLSGTANMADFEENRSLDRVLDSQPCASANDTITGIRRTQRMTLVAEQLETNNAVEVDSDFTAVMSKSQKYNLRKNRKGNVRFK